MLLALVTIFSTVMMTTACGGSEPADEDTATDVTIVISTSTGDGSFNDSAKAGSEALEAAGYKVQFVECNSNADQLEPNLRSAAENSKMVVAVGSEFTMLSDICKEYTDVKFAWVDNVPETYEGLDNLVGISYAQNEGSYLVGYVAAKESQTGTVGIVGGQDIDVINDFIVGFKQGAEAGGAKAISNYVNDPTWSDTELGSQCALDLKSKGADVIFQACGGCGIGVIQSAKDNGYMAIGVDCDQRITLPDYADYIYCSMVKEVGQSIQDLVKNYIDNGTFEGGQTWKAGLEGGYIGVHYGSDDQTQLVSDELKAEVEDQMNQIQEGKIVVDTVY